MYLQSNASLFSRINFTYLVVSTKVGFECSMRISRAVENSFTAAAEKLKKKRAKTNGRREVLEL